MPANLSRPAKKRLRPVQAVALCLAVPLATGSSAWAQALDAGAASSGGLAIRGTTDPSVDQGPDGTDAPSTNMSTLADSPSPVQRKFALPRMSNTALPPRFPVPLAVLKAYPASVRRIVGRGGPGLDDATPPGPTVAALPVPQRRVFRSDADPFGPIGYGIGSTRVVPYLEQSFGYDSNPEQVSAGVKGSAFSRTEGGFTLQSDWSAHDLKGTMEAGYDEFFSNPRANRPDARGVVDGRIDVTRDSTIDVEGRFDVDTQRPGSPELDVAVKDRPLITTFGGTLGGTQGFGRFSVGLHGLVDRTIYEDGELTDGTPVRLAYQDVTDYGVKAKLGYDVRPGFEPFVEIGYDRRIHDDTVDPFTYRRDSDGVGGRIGSSFEFWPQMTGTASAGYATRIYDDPRLKDLTGPTASASLVWAATPLTTLTLQANTAFNETTVAGSSGIEARSIRLAVSHALFRYLTLTAALAYERDQYEGVSILENTITASLKAEYHLTRSMVLTGTVSRQRLRSTAQGSDYTQNIVLVGLRLQH